ncbi:MAG: type I restriction enzyme, S subunit [Desulfobacteraceae bacterium Eth-SRB2]|nr:MAG: type I restriction enzyme, S subunit [Desulfobacteraceae bacterium Eth-SRB2]
MGSEWQPTKLGKVIAVNPSRPLSKGTYSVYISMQQVETANRTINEINHRKFKGSGFRFQNGDTLLARITPCLENGKTAFVDFLEEDEVAHGSTEFIVLSGVEDISDNLFVYYLARSPEFRDFAIVRMEGSSGRQRVPAPTLKNYKFACPPYDEQCAIAHILGSLDDKIELNRQMNETLEAMAQAIFKSWFADFDPVRAKAEGRDPGLPKEIADLFPDSFENSELGKIPEGWNVNGLGKLIDLAYGKALKASKRITGEVPVYGSNGPVGFHNEAFVNGPGIVVGRKGNPGTVTWSSSDFYPIDTTFYVILKKHVNSLFYMFYALKAQNLPSLSADSAVPGLNRNLAYMNQVLVPHKKILTAFDKHVPYLFARMETNDKESLTLSILRDTLLPKLISGELCVPDAEKFIKEAGL